MLQVGIMISEEDEEIIVGNPEGQYGIAFDPLDGCVYSPIAVLN